jgi:hypothetical protein
LDNGPIFAVTRLQHEQFRTDARKAIVISRQDCNSKDTEDVVATVQGSRIHMRRLPLDRALLNIREWEKGKCMNGAVS